MRRIERFEDLIAWQKARQLTKHVYLVSKQGEFGRDFGLSGQMQCASVSIMSNVAEGVERTGMNELHHFLGVAKGSAGEVRSQIYVAYDVGYLAEPEFHSLLGEAEEVGRILGGLRASVDKARNLT